MGVIKPIETFYCGHRFRSRLEARWAVWLGRNRIKYLYEDDGYHLPSGSYLPDFYLPNVPTQKGQPPVKMFLEIKPIRVPQLQYRDPIPEPYPREVRLGVELIEQMPDTELVVVYGDPVDVFWEDGTAITVRNSGVYSTIGPLDWIPDLSRAADAARAARFEHGETP